MARRYGKCNDLNRASGFFFFYKFLKKHLTNFSLPVIIVLSNSKGEINVSIMNAIANCRTPFKEGSCRQVHYSKKHNLVIKKMLYSTDLDRQEIIYDDYQHQTAREREIFEKLTSEERHFFPIIDFVHSKKDNMIVTLMRKIDFVIGDTDYDNLDLLDGMDREEQIEMLNRLKEHFHLHFNVEFFIDTIIKYNIIDLHPFNIGVYNNHLVIIDFGYDIMD